MRDARYANDDHLLVLENPLDPRNSSPSSAFCCMRAGLCGLWLPEYWPRPIWFVKFLVWWTVLFGFFNVLCYTSATSPFFESSPNLSPWLVFSLYLVFTGAAFGWLNRTNAERWKAEVTVSVIAKKSVGALFIYFLLTPVLWLIVRSTQTPSRTPQLTLFSRPGEGLDVPGHVSAHERGEHTNCCAKRSKDGRGSTGRSWRGASEASAKELYGRSV
jgi:hypothetical protein